MGVFQLWHLSHTMDDVLVHVVERLGSLLCPVLTAQRLRVVRLLGMDSRGHETVSWDVPRVIEGPINLAACLGAKSVSFSFGHLRERKEAHLNGRLLLSLLVI